MDPLVERWTEIGYATESTADGSLTLKGPQETMHHRGGALAETLFIYGNATHELFISIEKPRILSVGLGLGYVELVCAGLALTHGKKIHLESRESEAIFIETLTDWLRQQGSQAEAMIYDQIGQGVATALGHPLESIKKFLLQSLQSGDWKVAGALSLKQGPTEGPFHGVMYDAYSSKTLPDLWSEEALQQLMSNHMAQDSLFSTYACTGNLKRSLKSQGFLLDLREGFRGKRYSLLGRRGIFQNPKQNIAIWSTSGQILPNE